MINVIEELCEFTGLSRQVVEARAIHRNPLWPDHRKEWTLFHPSTPAEVDWFYRASNTYLLTNARHVCPRVLLDKIPTGARVLDFGGGSGNMSFALAERNDCKVVYYDLNELQKAFVRYVTRKHVLSIEVLEWADAPHKFPIGSMYPRRNFDAVVALDVFEHIPKYPEYIEQITSNMVPGSRMFVIAPFGNDEPSHLPDRFGFDDVCKQHGLQYEDTVTRVRIYRRAP